MAFENLSDKLQGAFRKLRGNGKVKEKDIRDAMQEVKVALLEADVNYTIVKDFVATVTEKALGSEVLESLTPEQQIIKIVNDELTALMGGENETIRWQSHPPTVIMMCGLQGAGKTTTSAKLGGLFKKEGKRPLLVACDVYRPAAIMQLQVVGEQLGLPVFTVEGSKDPVAISREALEHAKRYGNDPVILDTAGRLHIDEELMAELEGIKKAVGVHETLLVVDAMLGQDSVNVAKTFHDRLAIDGVILTKLDGDARGGSALSVRSVTGKPIKFIGTGEKLEELEPFYPDRMANRILGMGDVLSLIERAEQAIDEKKAAELEAKLKSNRFDLNDFLDQMQQVKKMGPLKNLLGMMPGVNMKALENADIDDGKLKRVEAIIQSMTMKERENPDILNASRKVRIAAGSGTDVQQVNLLLKQFTQMQQMMKAMNGRGGMGMPGMGMPGMGGMGMGMPGMGFGGGKHSGGHTKPKFKKKKKKK